MAEYGIKVSKTGKDVSSTEARDFVLHSSYNMLKIYSSAYLEVNEANGFVSSMDGNWKEVTHNLGYKPLVLLYYYHPQLDIWVQAPCNVTQNTTGEAIDTNLSMTVTHLSDNAIVLGFAYNNTDFSIDPPTGVYCKYYILVDPRRDAWYE